MRAVARACLSFALLALVAVGFSLTVRVRGASEAFAGEPVRIQSHGLPIARPTSEAGAAEPGTEEPGTGSPGGGGSASSGRRGSQVPVGRVAAETGEGVEDDLQLHNLAVWDSPDGSPNVFVSFTPVSADRMTGDVPFRKQMVDGEEVDVADVAPELDEADVRVEVDGRAVDVRSLVWYYAGYGDLGGADMKYMPVCLVRVARPELAGGEHELRLMVFDADTGALGETTATFECGAAEL